MIFRAKNQDLGFTTYHSETSEEFYLNCNLFDDYDVYDFNYIINKILSVISWLKPTAFSAIEK